MPKTDFLLLVTEEGSRIEEMLHHQPVGVLGLLATEARSPIGIGQIVKSFEGGALADALGRAGATSDAGTSPAIWDASIIAAVEAAGVRIVVTAYAPVSPVTTRLAQARPGLKDAGIALHQIRRDYDSLAWPHAIKGFSPLKQKIPQILRDLGLAG
jgi:deoxyribodipyrimidine photo-lyase